MEFEACQKCISARVTRPARLALVMRSDSLAGCSHFELCPKQTFCIRAHPSAKAPGFGKPGYLIGLRGRLRAFAVVAISDRISTLAPSRVSSFQRTEPNGLSSMRRTRTGAGPI